MISFYYPRLVPIDVKITDTVQRSQVMFAENNSLWEFSWDTVRKIPIVWDNDNVSYTIQHSFKEVDQITLLDALHAIGYRSDDHILYDWMNNATNIPIELDMNILTTLISSETLTQIDIYPKPTAD